MSFWCELTGSLLKQLCYARFGRRVKDKTIILPKKNRPPSLNFGRFVMINRDISLNGLIICTSNFVETESQNLCTQNQVFIGLFFVIEYWSRFTFKIL